ncbi:saccharopine dehydrogenase NADP-binding domain-containing protein [Candidatus Parcubacteria bacterium]|nr:saccharopine dehydrogenase NADP-binding domain-containing protein [Candidatus Parcubacteria bacterium]
MFNIAILGAGEQAQGVAHYLSNDPRVKKIVCYDNDDMRLYPIRKYLGNKGETFLLDASNSDALLRILQEGNFDGVFNALPYALLPITTETIIKAGLPGVDLGQATKEQECLRKKAEKSGKPYARACGIAPGFISDLAYDAMRELDVCNSIGMYAGGLLQNPRGKIGHASFFSVPGLYYEYVMPPEIIMAGKRLFMAPLAKSYSQNFVLPDGHIVKTESALTGDAFEPTKELWGDTEYVYYATMRHKGFNHFAQVREAIKNKKEDECIDWLWRNLIPKEGEKDMMLVRVCAIGAKNGVKTMIKYEIIDFYDEVTKLSAMKRCTAFPATETLLQMLSAPERWPAGFPYHEKHLDVATAKLNLLSHKLKVSKTITPDIS